MACYAYEGIDAVKSALRAGLALSSGEDQTVKINLIAPPLYVVTTVSLDKDKGIQLLTDALKAIQGVITEKKGSMNVKMEPRAVTESDEKELASMMERYEKENSEVAGDSGDDDESEIGMGGGKDDDDDDGADDGDGDGISVAAE